MAPTNVTDDITRLSVAKLDADTHDYVTGAHMAIIRKSDGVMVDEWTTDGTVHVNEQVLDVNETYILRELTAPEGYDAVPDVEFVVNEVEGTGVTVLSPEDDTWGLSESYKITVYDPPTPTEKEKVVHKKREVTKTQTITKTKPGNTPKTGDDPTLPITLAVVASVALVVLLWAFKRRKSNDE